MTKTANIHGTGKGNLTAVLPGVRMGTILTLRFRLHDKHAAELKRQSRAVNFVWNFCNETQQKAIRWNRKWPTGYDLEKLTAGSSRDLAVHSGTIKCVCSQYESSRRQHKKAWLKFRGWKSLGWVPFKKADIKFDGRSFKLLGSEYEPMHQREIPEGATLCAGSFNADSRGRWYINIPVEFPEGTFARSGETAVGIDLGLKDLAALSTDETISAPQFYRRAQERLGKAQRAGKKRLARNISTKVANCRKDHLHKASARIALRHGLIFVGDVSSSQLAQTRMAKSVLDAGWSTLRNQLSYKAMRHGGRMIEVDESYTSRTCSSCGARSGPKGIAGLGIREWICGGCGTVHDRDVNAARNILARGMASLAEGAAIRAEHSTLLWPVSLEEGRR